MSEYNTLPPNDCNSMPACETCGQDACEHERVAPPTPPGFTGIRGAVLGEAIDGAHVVRLVEYAFPDGSRVPYAEVHETHDGARPGRVMSLSALVHLAQNVSDAEVWQIGAREERPSPGAL